MAIVGRGKAVRRGRTGDVAASTAGTIDPSRLAEDRANFLELSGRWARPTLRDVDEVGHGLSFETIDGLNTIFPGVIHRIVPKSTLAALRKRTDRLPPEQSDRVYQMGKVFGFAMSIYRDEETVRAFFERRHPMLQDRRPLDVAIESGAGADLVINLLGRGAYGGGA